MKQLLYELYNMDSFKQSMSDIADYIETRPVKSLLFHLYCGVEDHSWIETVSSGLTEKFPHSKLVGISSNAEIFDGHVTDPEIVLSAMVFEKTEVNIYAFNEILGKEKEIGEKVCGLINDEPELKGVELLIQGDPIDNGTLLAEIQKCRKGIALFGGYPLSHDIINGERLLVTRDGIMKNALTLVTYSGKDFHIDVSHTAGWNTLGRAFLVTAASGNSLYEVDDFPAFELYSRYLEIQQDEHFVENVMEFPLMLEDHGIQVLRHPDYMTGDGSLHLAGNVEPGMKCYMAYGDPSIIIEAVNARCEEVRQFEPEAILLYSCAMRKAFWSYFVNNEMAPFQKMATTSGFYTGGELDRDAESGRVLWHNVTLLSIAMREGDKTGKEIPPAIVDNSMLHGQVAMVKRLTTLVQVTNEELQQAYDDLVSANERLIRMATTDELTSLYNRREIEQRINRALDSVGGEGQIALIMLDIDHFKRVNDTCGHETGDYVLREVSAMLKNAAIEADGDAAGRWGGEEFFLLLPQCNLEEAVERAQTLRKTVEAYEFDKIRRLTISLGVTMANGIEDRKKIFTRVDDALYTAKESGRNQVVVAKGDKS